MAIEVNLYAGAAEAIGAQKLLVAIEELPQPTLQALVEQIAARPAALGKARQVLDVCSFLIGGQTFGPGEPTVLADNVRVDVLPPFAGG